MSCSRELRYAHVDSVQADSVVAVASAADFLAMARSQAISTILVSDNDFLFLNKGILYTIARNDSKTVEDLILAQENAPQKTVLEKNLDSSPVYVPKPPVHEWFHSVPDIRANTADDPGRSVVLKVQLAYRSKAEVRLVSELTQRAAQI